MKRMLSLFLAVSIAAAFSRQMLNATAMIPGDLDGDDTVSAADAQSALIAYVTILTGKPSPLDTNQQKTADVNSDGTADAADAQLILLYYVRNTLAGIPTDWDTLTKKESENKQNDLALIATEITAFSNTSSKLLRDILANSGRTNTIVSIDIGYGDTFMGPECDLILQSLNYNYIVDDVVGYEFGNYSFDDLKNFKNFLYGFNDVLEFYNGDIDYSQFTLNDSVGNFLNDADQAYRVGLFDEFMVDKIVNGNISQEILDNPGAMAILYSYDIGRYLNFDDIDYQLSSVVNHVFEIAQGYQYDT